MTGSGTPATLRHIEGTAPVERRSLPTKSGRLADSQSAGPAPKRRLLTLQETAAYLGVSVWTVRDLVWKGKLPVVRLTRRLHFDQRDIDHMIDVAKDTE
jgi:excisionase family DNA binding protein